MSTMTHRQVLKLSDVIRREQNYKGYYGEVVALTHGTRHGSDDGAYIYFVTREGKRVLRVTSAEDYEANKHQL